MAIRDTSIPHFTVMFPLKRWWERAVGSSRWSHVSRGGWRCKPLAFPRPFPDFPQPPWLSKIGRDEPAPPKPSARGKTWTLILVF